MKEPPHKTLWYFQFFLLRFHYFRDIELIVFAQGCGRKKWKTSAREIQNEAALGVGFGAEHHIVDCSISISGMSFLIQIKISYFQTNHTVSGAMYHMRHSTVTAAHSIPNIMYWINSVRLSYSWSLMKLFSINICIVWMLLRNWQVFSFVHIGCDVCLWIQHLSDYAIFE